MNQVLQKLARPPIVEAVMDLDCDMPPTFALPAVEAKAREVFKAQYPKSRVQFLDEHTIQHKPAEPPQFSARRLMQALHFLHEDEKQLVQVRAHGFSFNRLAPYSSLDDYLPEIERTWLQFAELTQPVQIRVVRLRYINRLPLPLVAQKVDLREYFHVSPRLPDEERLILSGFLHQHAAVETQTGNHANIVLTSQPVVEGKLPVILDITVTASEPVAVDDWGRVLQCVGSLRNLKNLIFGNTLTTKCLSLFQAL